MKTLFFDVDGTLLPQYSQAIPENTVKAMDQLRKVGHKLVLCTGRGIEELDFTDFHFDGYILLNGQICLDEEFDPYYENPIAGLDKDALISLFTACTVPVVLTERNRVYMNFHNDSVLDVSRQISISPHPVSEYKGADIFMASVYTEQELIIGSLTMQRWHAWAFDVFPVDGGKQRGIQEYIKKYGIRQEDTIAFGDADNDVEMLKYCGISVAMGNGYENTKAIADMVTDDCNNNGIEKALKKLGLI